MTQINGWACVLLVSLRLVIGWHFVVEGYHKIKSHAVGPTSTNIPWSGAGFFREGYGPVAEYARQLLQLDDGSLMKKYRDPASVLAESEWEGAVDRWKAHYSLSEDQVRRGKELAQTHKAGMRDWIDGKVATEVKRQLTWGPVEMKSTVPQRLSEIDTKRKEIAEIQQRLHPAFNEDVEKARVRTLKQEIARGIAELDADLEARRAGFLAELASVLTPDQKKLSSPPQSPTPKTRIAWLDQATMWTHVVLGAMLLVGLSTRLASFGLALFLLSITLIAPALPFAPSPPGAVGHYLYVNLYTIEMVALLALACMPTGRWFGIDALFGSPNTVRRK